MSYEITDACVCCGDCADECKIGAVKEGEATYVIDQMLCVDCGACTYICDANAITTRKGLPEDNHMVNKLH
jgi:ferredoxin